jgi:hypothetical protein
MQVDNRPESERGLISTSFKRLRRNAVRSLPYWAHLFPGSLALCSSCPGKCFIVEGLLAALEVPYYYSSSDYDVSIPGWESCGWY